MLTNPHDALFKAVFGEPEHARGALRAVVPAALAEALDWPTLTRRPGSFVDAALREQHTDLLYSAAWRDGGGEALVYFLFEHQSSPPTSGLMAYRLLRYQVRIWERWCAEHPDARSLPMILPIVLYHGAVPWPEPRTFGALLEVPAERRPAIAPHLVEFEYLLDDLSETPDHELRDRAMMTALGKLAAMCFKHARTRADLLEILTRWMPIARAVTDAPHGFEALARVMRYILEVNQHVEPAALQSLLERELGPEAKDTIVTAGQRLIQQGLEQGIQQGERNLLLRQLRQRFGADVDAAVERKIAAATTAQIDTWALRIVSAPTLGELLAD